MPDGDVIDSLSLEIGASVNKSIDAIDQLQKHLGKLNNSLANFEDNGTYKKALDNLSNGFTNLGTSINSLNPDKISKVADSLKGLVKNANKINSSFGNSSSMGKGISNVSREIEEQGKSLAKQFGVSGARNVETVAQSFRELASEIDASGNKTTGFEAKLSDLVKTIQGSIDVGSLFGNSDSIAKQVREYVSEANKAGRQVYLPFEPSEFADNYRSMRATLGKVFTSDDLAFFEGAQDIASFAKELNGVLGSNVIKFDSGLASGNEADIFQQIYDLLVKARTEQEELTRSAQQYAINEADVASAVDAIIPKLQSLKMATSGDTGGETNGVTSLAKSLREMQGLEIPDFANLAVLAKSIGSFGNDKSTVASDNIPKIVQGLQPLSAGLTIPDFTNLASLASAVGRLGNENATNASTNIPLLASGLKTLDGVTVPDFSNLSGLANAVTRLGNANSQNATWVLPNIMSELESFSQHFSGLTIDAGALSTIQQLGSAFSKLGGKNANEAIKTLPQLSDAIRQMVEDLNTLPEVSDKTQQLVVALGNLAKANGKAQTAATGTNSAYGMLSKTMQGLSGWVFKTWKNTNVLKSAITALGSGVKNYNAGMNSAKAHTESLTGAIIKVRSIIWGLKRVMGFFSTAVENASSLTEVMNVVENVYDASYIEEFNKATQNTIETLGMSELTFKQFASRYQAMGKAMGITNSQMQGAEDHLKSMGIEYGVTTGKMGDMSVNLTRLAADMASFYDVAQEDVYTSLQAIYTGQTRPLSVAA